MNGGHQTLDDTEFILDNFCNRSQTVGRARSVGDDGIFCAVFVQVDTANEHGGIARRSRDDDPLGAALQMGRSPTK